MDKLYYVATDAAGVERRGRTEIRWDLPEDGRAGVPLGHPAELCDLGALLDRLDEVITRAEPIGDATETSDGILIAPNARLAERTRWDATRAARFALDVAAHVLGDAARVRLPNGAVLADVVADARAFLDGRDEPAGRLGRLARLSAARRLRARGELVGDAARGVLVEDLADELDATEDPAWTALAAVADAVLAAVEALRHVALGRYAESREELAGERDARAGDQIVPTLLVSAWGGALVGAETESPYMPASHLAREAALRARETVHQRDPASLSAERAYQRSRLEALLR